MQQRLYIVTPGQLPKMSRSYWPGPPVNCPQGPYHDYMACRGGGGLSNINNLITDTHTHTHTHTHHAHKERERARQSRDNQRSNAGQLEAGAEASVHEQKVRAKRPMIATEEEGGRGGGGGGWKGRTGWNLSWLDSGHDWHLPREGGGCLVTSGHAASREGWGRGEADSLQQPLEAPAAAAHYVWWRTLHYTLPPRVPGRLHNLTLRTGDASNLWLPSESKWKIDFFLSRPFPCPDVLPPGRLFLLYTRLRYLSLSICLSIHREKVD